MYGKEKRVVLWTNCLHRVYHHLLSPTNYQWRSNLERFCSVWKHVILSRVSTSTITHLAHHHRCQISDDHLKSSKLLTTVYVRTFNILFRITNSDTTESEYLFQLDKEVTYRVLWRTKLQMTWCFLLSSFIKSTSRI